MKGWNWDQIIIHVVILITALLGWLKALSIERMLRRHINDEDEELGSLDGDVQ